MEEPEDDFKTRFDQAAKLLAQGALETVAQAQPERELLGPLLKLDLGVLPFNEDESAWRELGLLGRMCRQACVLEFYHNPPSAHQVHLCSTRRNLWALQLRRPNQAPPWSGSVEPWLWIVSAGVPESVMEAFGLDPQEGWPKGVYSCPFPGWEVSLVVVPHLPRRDDTLLLRLMGKGKALQLAIEDMERLPPEDRLRQLSYQIVNMLRLKLKVNKDELTVEERDYMQITDPLYQDFVRQTLQQGVAQGVAQGEVRGLREASLAMTARLLRGRFGEGQDWLALLRPIQELARVEAVFEVGLHAQDEEAVLLAIQEAVGR